MVETLVAALVLAVGVLGTALLFMHGVQANRAALLRTEAVALAFDMAERIRANRDAGAAYASDRVAAGAAGRRAAADLAEWREHVAQRLPAPRDGRTAEVQFLEGGSAALPDRYRISVAWSEPGQRSISTQLQIVDLLSRLAP